MKKIIKIIAKYPPAFILFIIADIRITARFAKAAEMTEPMPVKYYIVLYGGLLAVLLFTTGWMFAAEAVDKMEKERRRSLRKKAVYASYSREFYGITEKS